MASAQESSQDKLDQMLREGRISREEHEWLSAALSASPRPQAERPETALESGVIGFASGGVMFLTILPFLLCQFVQPKVLKIYEELQVTLPALSRWSLSVGRLYAGTTWWLGVGCSLLVVAAATWVYLKCRNWQLRVFLNLSLTIALLWSALFVLGAVLPFFGLLQRLE